MIIVDSSLDGLPDLIGGVDQQGEHRDQRS